MTETREPVTVYINEDYTTLGEAATQQDLDRYQANLEAHLEERFERPVSVQTILGGRRCGRQCPEDDDIDEYVRDLERGDGWVEILAEGAPDSCDEA
jgi:hypothetical protein